MFILNETLNGKATLTVKNGKMTLHAVVAGTGYDKVYVGSIKNARKKGAKYCKRTTTTVKYNDGTKEKVYAFDIPVKSLNKAFTLSMHGKESGKWYSHPAKVTY